jgi:hypothetical protein
MILPLKIFFGIPTVANRTIQIVKQTNSMAFGQQANYTDRAITNGRRIFVPTFARG